MVEEGRRVWVTMHNNGVIKNTHDATTKLPFWEFGKYKGQDLPLDQEHFEWNLSKYWETGITMSLLQTSRVRVVPNDRDKGDRNTAKTVLPELVVLDCGYWGGYKRWREFDGKDGGPQREFGMIENGHVWLAEYVSVFHPTPGVYQEALKGTGETVMELEEAGAMLGAGLARLVATGGFGAIRLRKHAQAKADMVDDAVKRRLYVCFPDLHLPEAWPDLPTKKERNPDERSRRKLQERLRDCQRESQTLGRGNTLSNDQIARIQQYLDQKEMIEYERKRAGHRMKPPHAPNAHEFVLHSRKKKLVKQHEHKFTPEQFLAEKDVVDRELRLRSTWFYGRGKGHAEKPEFGDSDMFDEILKNGNGDATPAVDMVSFLFAIYELRNTVKPPRNKDIRVAQLGDLFETWLNHEFLYHGFWVRDTNAGAEKTYIFVRAASRRYVKDQPDDYQRRRDEEYDSDCDPAEVTKSKVYVYNHVPKAEMFYRHIVGDMIHEDYVRKEWDLEDIFGLPRNELKRRQELLRERLARVRSFSLPIPEVCGSKIDDAIKSYRSGKDNYIGQSYYEMFDMSELEKADLHDESLRPEGMKSYWCFKDADPEDPADLWAEGVFHRLNAHGQQEILWNKLILYLLLDYLGCECVYGNHDGYRGDPILNKKLEEIDRAPGWRSEKGIWFEHSHRWDTYNCDGCAFGAGVTNLVYYHFHNMCSKEKGEDEDRYGQFRWNAAEPGAGLWFLLTKYKDSIAWLKNQEGMDKVFPFGIYVFAHTHTGDLIQMRFELEKKAAGKDVLFASRRQKKREKVAAQRSAEAQRDEYRKQSAPGGGGVKLEWLKPRV